MTSLILRGFFAVSLLLAIAIGIDWNRVPELLSVRTLGAIAVMQVFLLIGTYLCSYRHAVLVRTPPAPVMSCWMGLMLSAGFNLAIPGRIAELIKATYLRNKHGIPLSSGTAAIVVERLYDVLIVASIGLVGAYGVDYLNPWLLVATLSFVCLIIVFLVPLGQLAIRFLDNRKFRLCMFIVANLRHMEATINPRVSLIVFGCSAFAWLLHYAGLWLFFQALPGHGLTLWQVAIVFTAIIFAGAIPALPAGIGLVQAAVIATLMGFGKDFNEALSLSLLLFLSEIFLSAVITPFLLMTQSAGIMPLIRDVFSKERAIGGQA